MTVSIHHVEGLNNAGGVIALAYRANLELIENGWGLDELNLGWDNNCIVATEGGEPVGIMVWIDQKHVRGIWLTLSYVVPRRRRQGIFRAMWEALVEKAREKNVVEIQSSTNVGNAPMRAAAAKVGRVEQQIQMVYRIPAAVVEEASHE